MWHCDVTTPILKIKVIAPTVQLWEHRQKQIVPESCDRAPHYYLRFLILQICKDREIRAIQLRAKFCWFTVITYPTCWAWLRCAAVRAELLVPVSDLAPQMYLVCSDFSVTIFRVSFSNMARDSGPLCGTPWAILHSSSLKKDMVCYTHKCYIFMNLFLKPRNWLLVKY